MFWFLNPTLPLIKCLSYLWVYNEWHKNSIKLLIVINIWANFCHLKTVFCWKLDWISWFWLTYTFSTCMWGWNIKWEREQRYHVESPEMFLQTWLLWLQNPKYLWNAIKTVSPRDFITHVQQITWSDGKHQIWGQKDRSGDHTVILLVWQHCSELTTKSAVSW